MSEFIQTNMCSKLQDLAYEHKMECLQDENYQENDIRIKILMGKIELLFSTIQEVFPEVKEEELKNVIQESRFKAWKEFSKQHYSDDNPDIDEMPEDEDCYKLSID